MFLVRYAFSIRNFLGVSKNVDDTNNIVIRYRQPKTLFPRFLLSRNVTLKERINIKRVGCSYFWRARRGRFPRPLSGCCRWHPALWCPVKSLAPIKARFAAVGIRVSMMLLLGYYNVSPASVIGYADSPGRYLVAAWMGYTVLKITLTIVIFQTWTSVQAYHCSLTIVGALLSSTNILDTLEIWFFFTGMPLFQLSLQLITPSRFDGQSLTAKVAVYLCYDSSSTFYRWLSFLSGESHRHQRASRQCQLRIALVTINLAPPQTGWYCYWLRIVSVNFQRTTLKWLFSGPNSRHSASSPRACKNVALRLSFYIAILLQILSHNPPVIWYSYNRHNLKFTFTPPKQKFIEDVIPCHIYHFSPTMAVLAS